MASTATFIKQAETFSSTRTFNFEPFKIDSQMWACFHIDVLVPAAAVAGTVKAQASANGGLTWVDIPSVAQYPTTQAITVTASYMFPIPQMGAPWIRVTVTTTNTSAATISVWGYAKGG